MHCSLVMELPVALDAKTINLLYTAMKILANDEYAVFAHVNFAKS